MKRIIVIALLFIAFKAHSQGSSYTLANKPINLGWADNSGFVTIRGKLYIRVASTGSGIDSVYVPTASGEVKKMHIKDIATISKITGLQDSLTNKYSKSDANARFVDRITTQSISGVKSFLDKIYIGTTTPVGTENVALKADITNTGNVVTRAGQFYSTQQGTQSFTGIDVQTDAQNSGAVDHVATNQNYTKLNNIGSLDKAWGVYHVGDKLSGAGVVNNAYGFYHAGWGGTIGKKWSFYAAADYMFLSASSGIAMNTFTPQELIDMENGDANGLGAKFNNAWAGNYNFAGSIASFGHYAMKSVNGGLSFLQLADGTTFLNSNAGKSTYLTVGLVNAARVTPGSKIQIGNSVDDATPDTGEELQVLGEIISTGIDTYASDLSGSYTARTKIDKGYADAIYATIANVSSSTYTPTLSNLSGASSATPFKNRYTKNGNVVTVYGQISVTSTSNNFSLDIELPIASNFTNVVDCSGTATSSDTVPTSGKIRANTADFAQLIFNGASTGSFDIYYSFSYDIL